MLENEDYFNLNLNDTESVSGTASSLNTWPSIIVTFMGGYVYDLFGRKYTIYYMILFSGFCLVMFPTSAPK